MPILSNLATALIYLRHPSLSGRQRYYLRFYYRGKIHNAKELLNDRVFRRPYKSISYGSEFAPELKFVLPHAYWHYKNGTLRSTVSRADTKCFYYFSPEHREVDGKREWLDYQFDPSIPNSHDHCTVYDFSRWAAVPLKQHYADRKIIFEKPTLVVSNKYNSEWGGSPQNYLSLDELEHLFQVYSEKYSIVYVRPGYTDIVQDNSDVLDLSEAPILKKYPSVRSIQSIHRESPKASFNELQIRVYAGCERFVSVQGGNSVLASYFGGTSIIYAVSGLEIEMGEYHTIFPRLSGANIVHVDKFDSLRESMRKHF